MDCKEIMLNNIDELHTTNLGYSRIKENLGVTERNVVNYCKRILLDDNSVVYKKGKNYYVLLDNIKITIHSTSYTLITAHLIE
jgi:hypothetical protein